MGDLKLTFILPNLGIGGVEINFLNLANYYAGSFKKIDVLYCLELDNGDYKKRFDRSISFSKINLKGFIKSIFSYSKYFNERTPDIILVPMYMPAVILIIARLFSEHKPKIIINGNAHFSSVIQNTDSNVIRYLLKPLAKIFYPLADFFICPSSGLTKDLEDVLKLSPLKLATIYNPILESNFDYSTPKNYTHPWFQESSINSFKLIMAGRLDSQKGVVEFIDIFKKLKKNENIQLLILGEGDEKQRIEEQIRINYLENDIKIIPFQNNFHAFLERSDLMVVNSFYEGLNNMIVHALAVGTSVISRNCPSGPSEILEDGKFGRLVALGDDQGMIEMIKDEIRAPAFKKENLIERSKDFSTEDCGEAYKKIFQKCVDEIK
ncbi:glycosyltransferase [Gammaproteobacteria bacterium]|nr:glycosyltransferase [Gammaproteobacteria bacterium]